MRVNPFLMPFLVIVGLLGAVFAAQVAGAWSVSGRTAVNTDKLAPADIKGWMTLQQVIDGIPIAKEDLYALVNLPVNLPTSTVIKDMEKLIPDFETSTLRDALVARLNGPAPIVTPTMQPTVQIIQPTAQPAVPTVHASPTPLPAGAVLPADQIKGKMSLRDVSTQCNVPLDRLFIALHLAPDTNPDSVIKDLVAQGKLTEVSAVQQAVTAMQQ